MIASLLRPEAYDHDVSELQLLETHISWVILTGRYAYKIKKPVRLEFVDFSTPERRRWCCDEEVRLNRRLAPALYRGVVPVCGPIEQATFAGPGPAVDWAVQMHQFPQTSLLTSALAAGLIQPAHWDQLADALAQFQRHAAVAGPDAAGTATFGTPSIIIRQARANLEALASHPAARDALPALAAWTNSAATNLNPTFAHRRAAGRIREGHGDLHLGNLILLDDRITVFDCLEFNPELRWIDVINDLAFLVMDLAEHGQPLDGVRLLNRWLDRTGDYRGLDTWRWYVVYRALVRAKVSALRLAQPDVAAPDADRLAATLRQYLDLARATVSAPTGRLVLTHGLSGSGKSHLARRLCHHLGWIHLRSDAERKRQFGLWGEGAVIPRTTPPDLYAPATTDSLYFAVLPGHADAALRAGFSVVVDATFLQAPHRRAMADLARRRGARFHILRCQVPAAVARERMARRARLGGDPSDATADILRHQHDTLDALSPDELACTIDITSESPPAEVAQQLG